MSKNARPTQAMREFARRFAGLDDTTLLLHLVGVVAGNTWLFWLFSQGTLTVAPYVLVLLVESVALTLLAELQRSRVPPAHRTARDGAQGSIEFVSLFLGATLLVTMFYGVWIWIAGDTGTLRALLASWSAWRGAGLHWALAITGGFALVAAISDHRHYVRHGPPLVSSLDLDANARRILYVYGVIPIALPMIAALGGSIALGKWAMGRWPGKHTALYAAAFALAAWFGTFFAISHLVDASPLGLAFAFLLGKTIVDVFFATMPWIVRRMGAAPDATDASNEAVSPVSASRERGRRRRRR